MSPLIVFKDSGVSDHEIVSTIRIIYSIDIFYFFSIKCHNMLLLTQTLQNWTGEEGNDKSKSLTEEKVTKDEDNKVISYQFVCV